MAPSWNTSSTARGGASARRSTKPFAPGTKEYKNHIKAIELFQNAVDEQRGRVERACGEAQDQFEFAVVFCGALAPGAVYGPALLGAAAF